ncbi:MAG TPA: glycosyl hydrolase family 28-related protein [Pyrinomonadaceae bacterium]|nr:glycosyl hydrolase family 28-related protein [Pyrinomonadaceae bacterium]
MKYQNFIFSLLIVLTCAGNALSQQNKFEGYNIILDVPEKQTSATCAIRYVPPTTVITITDLNPATPLKISPCAGSGTQVTQSGSTATMRANAQTFKWCFQGEDKKYRITFNGDQFSGPITYDWIATPDEKTLGFYNIRDFGAVGDGRTDDTLAFRSAFAFIATRNGGTLQIPEGDYLVGNVPNFKGLALPSGIVIQGVSGLQSNAATNNVVQKNPSRISLNATNRAIFRLGECTEKVTVKDLELFGNSLNQTIGIEALGAFTSSQDFYFERVSFSYLWRGISAYGLPVTDLNWQFDYIKINHCRFIYITDTGIYTNIRNSDWKISGSLFINPPRTNTQKADSMRFERVTAVLIQDTFGGGFLHARGGTFIDILDIGIMTVIGSQCESMTYSLRYNAVENPYAGQYTYPMTFLNNVLYDPIEFKARMHLVSVGNLYGPKTFRADDRLRVYSTGDRFCADGYISSVGCEGVVSGKFDRATVIFMTAQPGEGKVQGHPTYFGTDVEFAAPVQMASFLQNALPTGKSNGSMVYCSNCRRDTTPCQAGGSGAPAMVVNGAWSCL